MSQNRLTRDLFVAGSGYVGVVTAEGEVRQLLAPGEGPDGDPAIAVRPD